MPFYIQHPCLHHANARDSFLPYLVLRFKTPPGEGPRCRPDERCDCSVSVEERILQIGGSVDTFVHGLLTCSEISAQSKVCALFASPEGYRYLCEKLERAIRQQQEATPEPPSDDDECLQDFRWQCSILHDDFEPPQIEKIRKGIWKSDYWRIECEQYAKALDQDLLHQEDGQATTGPEWRSAAMRYKHCLQQNGFSVDEITLMRISIENQQYWEQEMEVL